MDDCEHTVHILSTSGVKRRHVYVRIPLGISLSSRGRCCRLLGKLPCSLSLRHPAEEDNSARV
jgi:hypothetical protein